MQAISPLDCVCNQWAKFLYFVDLICSLSGLHLYCLKLAYQMLPYWECHNFGSSPSVVIMGVRSMGELISRCPADSGIATTTGTYHLATSQQSQQSRHGTCYSQTL